MIDAKIRTLVHQSTRLCVRPANDRVSVRLPRVRTGPIVKVEGQRLVKIDGAPARETTN